MRRFLETGLTRKAPADGILLEMEGSEWRCPRIWSLLLPFKLLVLPCTRSPKQASKEESLFQSYQARVLSVPSSCTDIFSKTSAHVPVSPLPYLAWTFCSVPVIGLSASRVAPPISTTPRLSLLPIAVRSPWLTDLRTRLLRKCYFHTRSGACTCTRRCLRTCSSSSTRPLQTSPVLVGRWWGRNTSLWP